MFQNQVNTRAGYSAVGNMYLTNPIPGLVTDTNDLVKLFSEKDSFFVPYAKQGGSTMHSLLSFLYELYDLSSAQKIAIDKKADLCFGHGVTPVIAEVKGMAQDEGTATGTDNNTAFTEWFTQITGGESLDFIADVSCSLFRDKSITGTHVLKLSMMQVNGEWQARLMPIELRNCVRAYHADPVNDLNRTVYYTDKPIDNDFTFTDAKKKDNWKAVGIYPLMTQRGSGVIETVFWSNNKGAERKWYGRPMASIHAQYIDYQLNSHTAKITTTDLVSKVLMFFKNPSPLALEEAGINMQVAQMQTVDMLRRTMTNKGEDAQGIAAIFYDDEPPTVQSLNINRDSKFTADTRKDVQTQICAAHGIDSELIGLNEIKTGLSNNVVLDKLILADAFTVTPTQNEYALIWQKVFTVIADVTGNEQFKNYTVKFNNPISSVLERMVQARSTAPKQQTATTEPQIQTV